MTSPSRRSSTAEDHHSSEEVAARLLRVLTCLNDLHIDMTVRQAMCLLMVAAKPGITLQELYETLKFRHSLASRQVALLAHVGNKYGQSGLGLIRIEEGYPDRRQRVLHLTPKGEKIMQDIARDLNGKE
jgi:DNA-binding MarR family transcriptional regulator